MTALINETAGHFFNLPSTTNQGNLQTSTLILTVSNRQPSLSLIFQVLGLKETPKPKSCLSVSTSTPGSVQLTNSHLSLPQVLLHHLLRVTSPYPLRCFFLQTFPLQESEPSSKSPCLPAETPLHPHPHRACVPDNPGLNPPKLQFL